MTKAKTGKQIKVTQVGSTIGRPDSQRKILVGLGLKGIGQTKVLEDTASVQGMVKKVNHLINVENV